MTVATEATANVSRYYGRPILKPVVWRWEVPAYFFVGGLAGASAVLALAARLTGQRQLARNALLAAAGGAALCPPLLVRDLGRPERFHHMLRVFRPTSPMNAGSWILAAFASASAAAAAAELSGRVPALGRATEAAAGLLGSAVASYTGALVANTSVPAWHEARRWLPLLFASGAAASAGALASVVTAEEEAQAARRLALLGATAELVFTAGMERRLGELAAPYRSGTAAPLARASRVLTATGATLMALAGRRRPTTSAAGAMLLAGAAAQRFAVWQAGRESARRT